MRGKDLIGKVAKEDAIRMISVQRIESYIRNAGYLRDSYEEAMYKESRESEGKVDERHYQSIYDSKMLGLGGQDE